MLRKFIELFGPPDLRRLLAEKEEREPEHLDTERLDQLGPS